MRQNKFQSVIVTPKDGSIATPKKKKLQDHCKPAQEIWFYSERNFNRICILQNVLSQLPPKTSVAVFLSTAEWKSTLCNFYCRTPVIPFDHSVSVDHTVSTTYRSEKKQWGILSAASEVLRAHAEVLATSFYWGALIAPSPTSHKHVGLRPCAAHAFIAWVKTSRLGPYSE